MMKCSCRKSPTACGKPNAIAGGYQKVCLWLNAVAGSFPQLAGNQMQCTEVTNTVVLHFRRSTEVLRKLRETSGGLRKSYAICGEPTEMYGSLAQVDWKAWERKSKSYTLYFAGIGKCVGNFFGGFGGFEVMCCFDEWAGTSLKARTNKDFLTSTNFQSKYFNTIS